MIGSKKIENQESRYVEGVRVMQERTWKTTCKQELMVRFLHLFKKMWCDCVCQGIIQGLYEAQ